MDLNWCSECKKFKKWDNLRMTTFVPDSDVSTEYIEYQCVECIKENHGVEDYPANDGGLN